MTNSINLIETSADFKPDSLNISLGNAKQIVIGRAPGFGYLVHISATTPKDMNTALVDFSGIRGVVLVTQLAIQTQ